MRFFFAVEVLFIGDGPAVAVVLLLAIVGNGLFAGRLEEGAEVFLDKLRALALRLFLVTGVLSAAGRGFSLEVLQLDTVALEPLRSGGLRGLLLMLRLMLLMLGNPSLMISSRTIAPPCLLA